MFSCRENGAVFLWEFLPLGGESPAAAALWVGASPTPAGAGKLRRGGKKQCPEGHSTEQGWEEAPGCPQALGLSMGSGKTTGMTTELEKQQSPNPNHNPCLVSLESHPFCIPEGWLGPAWREIGLSSSLVLAHLVSSLFRFGSVASISGKAKNPRGEGSPVQILFLPRRGKRSSGSWQMVFPWKREAVPSTALPEGSRKIISASKEQSPVCPPGNKPLSPWSHQE